MCAWTCESFAESRSVGPRFVDIFWGGVQGVLQEGKWSLSVARDERAGVLPALTGKEAYTPRTT